MITIGVFVICGVRKKTTNGDGGSRRRGGGIDCQGDDIGDRFEAEVNEF